jgi:hypothetical protein
MAQAALHSALEQERELPTTVMIPAAYVVAGLPTGPPAMVTTYRPSGCSCPDLWG